MSDRQKTIGLDPENGAITVGPLRYLLIRPETLSEIQKGIEDRLGPKSSEYIYSAGASWAIGACRRLKSALSDDPKDLAQALCQHATELGWGHWTFTRFDPEAKKLTIKIQDSPFAVSYGLSDQPVCHLAAGAIGGLAEIIFSMPTSCIEQSCKAQGQPDCLFTASGHDVAASEQWNW